MSIISVAVFCGSKEGSNALYKEHAKKLGYLIAQKNITLIYGGSSKGIMGAVANAVLEKNGIVIGVLPKIFNGTEHRHDGISTLYETDDMHSRKKMLFEKADAAIILPGGYGTMDEFFEMLTWNQLAIHNKKIFILNSAGFYDCLIAQLKKMEEENFLYKKIGDQLTIVSHPEELDFG